MSAKPMQDATAIAADVTLTLCADNGYQSTEKHRVSAEQWGVILKVANGKVGAKAAGAAPDLLQELKNIANADTAEWDDPTEFEAWAKNRARAAIAKATGEAQ